MKKKQRPLASLEWRIIGFLRGYEADCDATNVYDRYTHGRTPAHVTQADEVFINYVPCTLTREEYDSLHPL